MNFRSLYALILSTAAAPAFAWTTESIAITGGTFTLSDLTNTFGVVPVLAGPTNVLDDGVINGAVDIDGVHGSAANPVTAFDFLGISWNTFFAHSVETCSANCASMITLSDPDPGAITMTGTPWDPVISADFSGFFAEWNGNRFWQGGLTTGTGSWIIPPPPGAASGLYNFTLHWSLVNPNGPFQGFTSDWVLTGTAVAVVPEPGAYALMLVGLGGVAATRRRQSFVRLPA